MGGRAGPHGDPSLPAKMETMRRQLRVEELHLKGVPNHQIAIALGVADSTVSLDVKAISGRWRGQKQKLAEERELLYWGAAFIKHQALVAWERSKQNAEQTTTFCKPRPCPDCDDGMVGEDKDEWCGTCGGTGKVTVEETTHVVKGQAGDASLLKTALDAHREMARLRGFGERKPKKTNEEKAGQQSIHTHFHANLVAGVDWEHVPADVLLQMRSAARRLLNGKVLDVESK